MQDCPKYHYLKREGSTTQGKLYNYEKEYLLGTALARPVIAKRLVEIAKAVEEIFGVRVIKVTTLHVNGKTKRVGANPQGKTRSWKKAVVKLSEDSKNIEIFENMA